MTNFVKGTVGVKSRTGGSILSQGDVFSKLENMSNWRLKKMLKEFPEETVMYVIGMAATTIAGALEDRKVTLGEGFDMFNALKDVVDIRKRALDVAKKIRSFPDEVKQNMVDDFIESFDLKNDNVERKIEKGIDFLFAVL